VGGNGGKKEGAGARKRKGEGAPLFAMVTAWKCAVHLNDADLIRQVCITKRRNFPKVSVCVCVCMCVYGGG
jgi:hypothetical protein